MADLVPPNDNNTLLRRIAGNGAGLVPPNDNNTLLRKIAWNTENGSSPGNPDALIVNPATGAITGPVTTAEFYTANPPAVAWGGITGTITNQSDLVTYIANRQNLPNVKSFGATANGSTDDTVAIQAAITAGSVFMPKGANQATATNVLTATGTFSNNETLTIGGVVYTMKTTLTPAANEILIGANLAASLVNIEAALFGGNAGAGTQYGTATLPSQYVRGTATATTLTVRAIQIGSAGNLVTTTDGAANASWATATLTGGVDSYLITDELLCPSNRVIMVESGASIKRTGASVAAGECCFVRNTDLTNGNENISIIGGAWFGDGTNVGFAFDNTKPLQAVGFRFWRVNNILLDGITTINTRTFCFDLEQCSKGTAQNIWLNNTYLPSFQDGLHWNGFCKDWFVANIKGATGDDFLGLNFDDQDTNFLHLEGNGENFVIDGLFMDRAVNSIRILLESHNLINCTIKNVFGSATGRGFDIGRAGGTGSGYVDGLTIENYNVTGFEGIVVSGSMIVKNIIVSNSRPILSTSSFFIAGGTSVVNSAKFIGIDASVTASLTIFSFLATINNIEFVGCSGSNPATPPAGGSNGVFATFFNTANIGDVSGTVWTRNLTNDFKFDTVTVQNFNVRLSSQGANNPIFAIATEIKNIDLSGANIANGVGYFLILSTTVFRNWSMSGAVIGSANGILIGGSTTTATQKWRLAGNVFDVGTAFVPSATVNLSLSTTDFTSDRTVLTPLSGDVIRNSGTEPKGIITYNGSAWVSLQPRVGTFTLVAGAATVANTAVTANSLIVPTLKTIGGTGQIVLLITPTATTGFTAAGAATDTSTYNYAIWN